MSEFPDYFSCVSYVGTSTGAVKTARFGFIADWVELESTGALDFWADPRGDGTATTDDYKIPSATARRLEGVPISEVSMTATGTSTGGAAAYRVTAMRKGAN